MSNTVLMTQMSHDDLKALISEAVRAAVKQAPPFAVKADDDLLKIEQVAKLLCVSISTVARWKKNGKLKFMRMGGRVYFRKVDVMESFKKINSN